MFSSWMTKAPEKVNESDDELTIEEMIEIKKEAILTEKKRKENNLIEQLNQFFEDFCLDEKHQKSESFSIILNDIPDFDFSEEGTNVFDSRFNYFHFRHHFEDILNYVDVTYNSGNSNHCFFTMSMKDDDSTEYFSSEEDDTLKNYIQKHKPNQDKSDCTCFNDKHSCTHEEELVETNQESSSPAVHLSERLTERLSERLNELD